MAFGSGTVGRIYYDVSGTDTAVGHETECTVSLNAETEQTVTKDSGGGGWQSTSIGTKSASFSGTAVFEEDTTYGLEMSDIYDYWVAGTAVTLKYKAGETTGNMILSVSVVFTSMEITSSADENITYSWTAESTGAITKTAVV